jgi:hypothetical protein
MSANGENPQFTEEEVKAIVSAAKDYGFKVACTLSWCGSHERERFVEE